MPRSSRPSLTRLLLSDGLLGRLVNLAVKLIAELGRTLGLAGVADWLVTKYPWLSDWQLSQMLTRVDKAVPDFPPPADLLPGGHPPLADIPVIPPAEEGPRRPGRYVSRARIYIPTGTAGDVRSYEIIVDLDDPFTWGALEDAVQARIEDILNQVRLKPGCRRDIKPEDVDWRIISLVRQY